ncbi:MAG: RluA family pseudouridine synthase [Bacteroidales bacterium]|nr:RluA family pseudouridine synthase [Bacteroidales bacterium]
MNFESLQNRIIYEDNHIIAVNKLPGEIVQTDATMDEALCQTIQHFIKERDQKPGNVFVGVPHRLDRPVSGVTLFAKTGKALERLNRMFSGRDIQKKYWAITMHKPSPLSGALAHYLVRNHDQNKSYAHLQPKPGAKEALLNYHYIGSSDRYHFIEVELLTGRHHQIRAQLSAIGCPIKGDLKYGAPRSNPDAGISLHARSISFIHPVKQTIIELVAPPPDDILWTLFTRLQESRSYSAPPPTPYE